MSLKLPIIFMLFCITFVDCESYISKDNYRCWVNEEYYRLKNKDENFERICGEGYSENSDGTCIDIDECEAEIHNCDDKIEECVNGKGYFTCVCKPGFQRSFKTGRCMDVDECKLNTHNCRQYGSTCKNMKGSYKCLEKDDSGIYADVDECSTEIDHCGADQYCVNTLGSYVCYCNGKNKSHCIDDYEPKYKCVYDNGEHMCVRERVNDWIWVLPDDSSCLRGYRKIDERCWDVNECSEASHNCTDTEVCKNTPGGFECRCKVGYEKLNGVCTNIDECQSQGACRANEYCLDVPGTYLCVCKDGYSQQEDDCDDVDECAESINRCEKIAFCENTLGSFACRCMDGYEADKDGNCININECLQDNICGEKVCSDAIGGFKCDCKYGYQLLENDTCIDVNECGANKFDCVPNSYCINTQGSYYCECFSGFHRNHRGECEDYNECKDRGRCGRKRCHNTLGSYHCGSSNFGKNTWETFIMIAMIVSITICNERVVFNLL